MKRILISLFVLGAAPPTACDAGDGPLEEAAEDLDNVVEPHAGNAGDVADDIGDGFEDAADEVEDAVDTPQ